MGSEAEFQTASLLSLFTAPNATGSVITMPGSGGAAGNVYNVNLDL